MLIATRDCAGGRGREPPFFVTRPFPAIHDLSIGILIGMRASSGTATGVLCRDQRGAGAGEGIQHGPAPPGAVLDGVGQERDRLDSGRFHLRPEVTGPRSQQI